MRLGITKYRTINNSSFMAGYWSSPFRKAPQHPDAAYGKNQHCAYRTTTLQLLLFLWLQGVVVVGSWLFLSPAPQIYSSETNTQRRKVNGACTQDSKKNSSPYTSFCPCWESLFMQLLNNGANVSFPPGRVWNTPLVKRIKFLLQIPFYS